MKHFLQCRRDILILISILLFSCAFAQGSTISIGNWKDGGGQDVELTHFSTVGNETSFSQQYRTSFVAEPNGEIFYLVVPPNWGRYSITINDSSVFESHPKIPSQIFSYQIIPIDKDLLAESNTIAISVEGHRLLRSFREENILLTSSHSKVRKYKILNVLKNNSFQLFILIALIFGGLGLVIGTKLSSRFSEYIYLGFASFFVIPHHLLSTDFYIFCFDEATEVFKFQIMFQIFSWLLWGVYLLKSIPNRNKFQNKFSKIYINFVFLYIPLTFVAYFLIPFETFYYLAFITCLVPCILAPAWIFSFNRDNLFFILLLTSSAVCGYVTIFSDIVGANSYYHGYTIAGFTIVSLANFLKDFLITADRDRKSAVMLDHLLPKPVFNKLEDLIAGQKSFEEIEKVTRGDQVISNVFVDICSYGKLSMDISPLVVERYKKISFTFISDIFVKHNHAVIKVEGDNLHLVNGINYEKNVLQSEVASQTLTAILELLSGIDKLNGILHEKNLPSISIKVSAAMGHCKFGFEGSEFDKRFDIQGHWVNVAKRFEQAMDDEFYKKYGRNCALISRDYFKYSGHINFRKFFKDKHTVTDKHGISYDALVGTKMEKTVSKEQYLNAIYGQFSHEKLKKSS